MHAYLHSDIPVVAICNISETFFDFLNRANTEETRLRLIQGEQFRGDRTLLWLGDPKLVFVTYPIPHADYLLEQFNYHHTRYVTPTNPSPWLSLDIMRETPLLEQICDYAGPDKVVQIIPYATTHQFLDLVDLLRSEYGLTVLLPESPQPENLWVRDYIDTKTGFRILAPRWLDSHTTLVPEGVVCQDLSLAANVVRSFCRRGIPCLVKADTGENGIGNLNPAADCLSLGEIIELLQANPFLAHDWLTVERLILSRQLMSPSLEMFVPPLGAGDPELTYVSNQLFLEFGDFCGVVVTRELMSTDWYAELVNSGHQLARGLQTMGYVGHFDIDAVVDDNGQVFLLEINSRRTGGTHVHEFAKHVLGPDYLKSYTLLSHDTMKCKGITAFEELHSRIRDLLFPIDGAQRGVVISVTSSLRAEEFGCIVVASTADEAVSLQQELVKRIQVVPEHSCKSV